MTGTKKEQARALTDVVHVRVSQAEKARLEAYIGSHGTTISDVIRGFINTLSVEMADEAARNP